MNGTYWNNTSICTGRDYFWLQCIVQDSCEMFVGMTRCWPMRGPGLHDRPIRGEARLRVLPGPGEVRWPSLDMGALFAGLDFGPFWILSSNSFIWLYQRWNDIACWLLTITFSPFNGEVTVFVCILRRALLYSRVSTYPGPACTACAGLGMVLAAVGGWRSDVPHWASGHMSLASVHWPWQWETHRLASPRIRPLIIRCYKWVLHERW